jgi:predicted AAA+ superfamily ATPase
MLIPRRLPAHIRDLANFFPAISLTGPRQAGKTTLLKEMFPDYKYVSLENPTIRLAAKSDPASFLAEYNDKVIFDEAQRFPDLFSYLQGMIDEDRRPGRFILSGSQNFLLRKNISQSLAGRIGIVKLLPLDNTELKNASILADTFEEAILTGGYPGLINEGYPREAFYSSYVATYLERDVIELVSSENLDLFQRFIQVCATYTGQAINLSKISNDIGVSVPTVRSWIGILEQSYIIFRLQPFFRNIGKRLAKTSKLYFFDTGLACHLLGLHDIEEVKSYDKLGALFENMMIADALKYFHHMGATPRFYYYRDTHQQEVDLVYERGNFARLWEMKISWNYKPRMIKTMERVAEYWDRPTETNLIYTGDEEHRVNKSTMINWRNVEWKK